MTNFFRTRVENQKPKENKKKSSAADKKQTRKTPRSASEKTLTQAL